MTNTGQQLGFQCGIVGLPAPVLEYRFHPTRKWRFDLAWPQQLLAVEIDGGVFSGGRHSRGAGYRADCEKFAEAAILGWRVIRVLPEHVKKGQALAWIERALSGKISGALEC